jgi:membrane-bound lytic murein transglycosylase D
MRNILTQDFLFISIFISITNFCIATPQQTKDTTLLAENKTNNASMIIKEANVEYPVILEDQKEQSLAYVQKFSGKMREFIIKMHDKGENYFPQIESILAKYDLPEEFKVMVPLESQFRGAVVSKSGAVGYWQMMDAISIDYGLSIGKGKKKASPDDRKNLFKSTVAATKYLRHLYTHFNNDILLAVASYNCGEGHVMRAIKRSGITDPSFWDIKNLLPVETRKYVMNFISLNVIFNNYDKYVSNDLLFTPVMVQNTDPVPTIIN